MRRRSGMVLVLVLFVLLIGGAFVYVAFDIAGNAHKSAMNMVTEDRLYNAAQSGLEFGKARLWEHFDAGDLYLDSMGTPDSSADVYAEDLSNVPIPTEFIPEPDSPITIEVFILSCNYEAPTNYIEGLPPIFNTYVPPGSGSELSIVGTSGFIDPNRDLIGGAGEGGSVFVIRSSASYEGRSCEVETMVVLKDES